MKRYEGPLNSTKLYLVFYCCAGLTVLAGSEPVAGQGQCGTGCTPTQCTFDGVPHTALGNATMSLTKTCHLLISNIGTTGDDGVSQVPTEPSNATFVCTNFACPNFLESQPGAMEITTVRANVPSGIYCQTTAENIGGNTIEVRPDFSSVGATLYTITVKNGDTVTGVFTDLPIATFQTEQCDKVVDD